MCIGLFRIDKEIEGKKLIDSMRFLRRWELLEIIV